MNTPHPPAEPVGLNRRQVLTAGALAAPAIVLTTAVPAYATSANSALSVDIASATITAGSSSNVTATVLNSQGLGWAGQTVTLAVTGSNGATLTSTTGVTDSAGQYTTTLNVDSFTANGATIAVTATSGPLTDTDTTTVTGGVTLELVTTAAVAGSQAGGINAGNANTVTATLKNASGTGISNRIINFDVTGITGTYSAATATTNASGVATVTLTPNTWTTPGTTATVTASTTAGAATVTTTVTPLVLGANALLCGSSYNYSVGDGTTTARYSLTQPLRIFPSPVKQISGGSLWDSIASYTMFLLEDGSVWGVGRNHVGQLGLGNTTDRSSATKIAGLSKVGQIACGVYATYAISLTDPQNPSLGGALYAWGTNANGELGDGTYTQRNVPTLVSGMGSDVLAVAAHARGACAVMTDGTVKAWGYGGEGQLGNGTWLSSTVPVTVSGISDATDVTAGAWSLYARRASGAVSSWGYGGYGMLGNGLTTSSNVPVSVTGLTGPVTQITSAFATVYALTSSGSVMAWGANDIVEVGLRHYGNVGNNSSVNVSTATTVIPGNVLRIGASSRTAFAQLTDGTFRAWSYNGEGQFGNGNTGDSWTPAVANSTLPAGRTVTGIINYGWSSVNTAYVTAP